MNKNKIFILLVLILIGGVTCLNSSVYADNSTEIVFEVTEPVDDSSSEDYEGEDIMIWEAGQDWVINRNTKAILTFYLAKNKFVSISLDDQVLTEKQEFTLSGDYTTISFKKDYLNNLSEGRHEIIARFTNLDEEEEEALFSTYITIYTEDSAEAAGIVVPNTGFFSAVGEIATQSFPVVFVIILAAVGIFTTLKLRSIFKKHLSIFHWPRIHFTLFDKLVHFFDNHKPSTRSTELIIFVFLALVVTGGLGTTFHYLSSIKGDASSAINLVVDTTENIASQIVYRESIARAVDTVNVETEPGVEYYIFMSAGSDNALHADNSEYTFTENTNLVSLSDGSWGFNTDPDSSIFSSVPKEGQEVLVAHATEPGETKVYYAAKVGDDFTAGLYKGTVHYTIIAKTSDPIAVTPSSDESSRTVTITTPLVKNGDMNIDAPSITIGEHDCVSPNLNTESNHFITITCTVPNEITPGSYDVSLEFDDIEQEITLTEGYTEPEPTPEPDPEPEPTPEPEPDPNPEPTPDPGPAPEPEPDPEPEPSITYYTVTSASSNSTYGSTNRTSTQVAAGTTFTSSGNVLTFSDGRTIVATAKKVTGYSTYCGSWTPASGTVNSNMSVTANCTGTVLSYSVTVKVNNSSYGTANASEIWVPYNTTYSSNGNTLTFSNGRTITVTPTSTTGYNTSCNGWSPSSGTVTGGFTVTANCTRTAKNYTMTFRVKDSSYGSVSSSSASIPYGTTYSSSGNTITFSNGTKITATPTSATGYDTTCKSWSPSSGTVKANTTFTATCTRTAKKNTVTYLSNNDKNGSKSYTVSTGDSHTIKPLANFAGTRYSNVYNLNSSTYQKWTKEGYYFDYWEGSDGKKYAPAGQNEGHNPYAGCTTCLSTFKSDGSGLTLKAHFTKMNNINLAAITLAWPDGYTSDDTMIASNKSAGWSHKVTLGSPYSKTVNRFTVAPTPEFKTAAKTYYTNSNRRNSVEGNSLASNQCDNYYSLGCSGSWYTTDKGYLYGRSCDRFAAISIYYGIKGFGNTTIKIPFGLPSQARYFARGDQGWKAVNTKDNSKTGSSTSGTANNAGRYESHYQPGDVRLVYRTSSKHETYKLKFDGNTYYLGHIAIYVKTEDGLSHIAEARHSTYAKNGSNYNGDFIFAHTAYSNGGGFGYLSPFYYKTTAGGYDKNEWYAIWRYTGNGN